MALALHRKRADEARAQGKQAEFEAMRHGFLNAWCTKMKVVATCGTLNSGPGARAICSGCSGRHAWLCHGCGYVSFFEECVQGCPIGVYGWSCIYGSISRSELTRKLVELDPETWDEPAVSVMAETLLQYYDRNGNGDLQFTEFYQWMSGSFRPEYKAAERQRLIDIAVARDRADCQRAKDTKRRQPRRPEKPGSEARAYGSPARISSRSRWRQASRKR